MKNLIIYALISGLLVLGSCTKDFEEIDAIEDTPTELEIDKLLPAVIFEPMNSHGTMDTWLTDQIMHYYVRRNDNQLDVYDFPFLPWVFNDVWASNYAAIRNINDMIELAETENQDAYVAAGKILKAYHLARLTELWIDVPASEAGVSDILLPAYDRQSDIFDSILTMLEEANTLLDDNASFDLGGDVLFNGDISRWKKMANSLRLRYLLRVSNVASINASAQINTIVSDPSTYPIITSNDDMAIYDFSGVAPDQSAFSGLSITSIGGISMSKRMQDSYASYGDPRVDFFFEYPTNTDEYPDHEGIPNGITREVAQGWNTVPESNTSILKTYFVDNPDELDYTFITHAEMQFILAEAAMNGWINTGTSDQEYYENAITANFNRWGITMPDGFLSQTEVVWDGSLERLMDQKWMAYFFNSTLDSWGELKRTGYPALTVGSLAATVSGGEVATRAYYPEIEQSINSANYQDAVSNIGADNIIAKHWYQN